MDIVIIRENPICRCEDKLFFSVSDFVSPTNFPFPYFERKQIIFPRALTHVES